MTFNGNDYDRLFDMGRELYLNDDAPTRKRIATTLMAMSEYVRGQKVPWPCISKRYRLFTRYPIVELCEDEGCDHFGEPHVCLEGEPHQDP